MPRKKLCHGFVTALSQPKVLEQWMYVTIVSLLCHSCVIRCGVFQRSMNRDFRLGARGPSPSTLPLNFLLTSPKLFHFSHITSALHIILYYYMYMYKKILIGASAIITAVGVGSTALLVLVSIALILYLIKEIKK